MHTRPALKVLVFYVLGLLVGRYYDFPLALVLGFTFLALLLAFILWYVDKGNQSLTQLCLAVGLCLAGFGNYELATGYLPPNHIVHFTRFPDPVAISGIVSKYPDERPDRLSLTVSTKEIFVHGSTFVTAGDILVNVSNGPNQAFQYGDEIIVRGRLRKPRDRRNPGEFDYRAYLLAQGIHGLISVSSAHQINIVSVGHGSWTLRQLVYPVKDYLDHYIEANLSEKESALLQGLLIGERGEISPELRDSFARVGVIHLLAVSGLHVGFIVLIFMGLFGLFRIPFRVRVILTIAGLLFYAYLTNLKPPVVRASLMGGLLLAGSLLNRKTDVVNTLAIAALVILIFNPLDLFQSGFQLSFAAVISILYLYPKLRQLVGRVHLFGRARARWFVRYPLELLMVSAAAFCGTLPFTILYFNRLPGLAVFTNLLCVPLAFSGLASGIAASGINLVFPALAGLYMNAAGFFLQTLIHVVEWASEFHVAQWESYGFTLVSVAGYFVGLALVINLHRRLARRWLVIYALVASNVIVWSKIAEQTNSLQVIYLDVGQGDAALLTFPDGRRALIDGGPRGLNHDAGEWVIAPYLKREKIEEIDVLILSHADSDHLGGLPYVLRNFKVREVWDNGQTKDSGIYREYLSLVDSLAIRRRILVAGQHIADFDPVHIFVVHPSLQFLARHQSAINDGSLSLKVSFGEMDFLFVGDVEQNGELAMSGLGEMLESDALKVGHHGSKTSTSPTLLAAARPTWCVISAGELNKFGHPDQRVIDRLEAAGSKVLRTDEIGAVILETDGREIRHVLWR